MFVCTFSCKEGRNLPGYREKVRYSTPLILHCKAMANDGLSGKHRTPSRYPIVCAKLFVRMFMRLFF